MRLVHQELLHVSERFHFLLQQVSDVRVARFHRRLQHLKFWKGKYNHRPASAVLHRVNRLESSRLSSQLRLVYPVGEVGGAIQQSNLVRALNLPALNLIYVTPSLYVCGASKLRQLLQ